MLIIWCWFQKLWITLKQLHFQAVKHQAVQLVMYKDQLYDYKQRIESRRTMGVKYFIKIMMTHRIYLHILCNIFLELKYVFFRYFELWNFLSKSWLQIFQFRTGQSDHQGQLQKRILGWPLTHINLFYLRVSDFL